jgi:hypothetical protein
MKSIKPGRGPSIMGAIGSILAAAFGIVWTILAASMGVFIFAIFGIIFVIAAIVQAIFNYKNATGKNRYSIYDITDETEENDPLNIKFKNQNTSDNIITEEKSNFCPFCGQKLQEDFLYCKNCGKKIP